MSFTTESELRSAIKKDLTTAVQTTVDEIHEQNEHFIDEVVYDVYSPSWYDRTGDFGNSWATRVGSAGSFVEGEFYFKPNIIVNQLKDVYFANFYQFIVQKFT